MRGSLGAGELRKEMPPRGTKRSGSPGGPPASGDGPIAQKKSKPIAADESPSPQTIDSIFVVVSRAIGAGGGGGGANSSNPGTGGLPIPQLLQIIACYAAPFVTTQTTLVRPAAETHISPVCAIDSEWIIACDYSGSNFVKVSLVSGMQSAMHRLIA